MFCVGLLERVGLKGRGGLYNYYSKSRLITLLTQCIKLSITIKSLAENNYVNTFFSCMLLIDKMCLQATKVSLKYNSTSVIEYEKCYNF